MMTMRYLLLALLLSAPLPAQFIHFGVKGGTALNDAFDTSNGYKSRFDHWTLGPTAELRLPFGLSAEFNALYKSTGYASPTANNSAGSWEFPITAKYKFPGVFMRPYVEAGFSYRHIGDMAQLVDNDSKGFVAGAGVSFGLLRMLSISPGIRYTRWNNDIFTNSTTNNGNISSSKNQAEFLIGLTF